MNCSRQGVYPLRELAPSKMADQRNSNFSLDENFTVLPELEEVYGSSAVHSEYVIKDERLKKCSRKEGLSKYALIKRTLKVTLVVRTQAFVYYAGGLTLLLIQLTSNNLISCKWSVLFCPLGCFSSSRLPFICE